MLVYARRTVLLAKPPSESLEGCRRQSPSQGIGLGAPGKASGMQLADALPGGTMFRESSRQPRLASLQLATKEATGSKDDSEAIASVEGQRQVESDPVSEVMFESTSRPDALIFRASRCAG